MALKVEPGTLIFKKEDGKNRPFVCVSIYTNSAGIPYEFLAVPITSKTTVGMTNLFQLHHEKLHKVSYAKISNLTTIKFTDIFEVKNKIDIDQLDNLIEKICENIKFKTYVKGKITRRAKNK